MPEQEHEPEYWPVDRALTEAECRDLAAGRVPDWLKENARALVDFTLQTGRVDYVGMRETQQHQAPHPQKKKR
jgi:hypothetical protein